MLQRRWGLDAGWIKTALRIGCLSAVPLIIALVSVFGPLRTDARYSYSGIAVDVEPGIVPGLPTIDGNMGITSQALGIRAAIDVVAGRLPLWNHYEGLGAPLLGEMQSAALFPPTWLMPLRHGQALEQAFLQWLAGVGAYLFFRRFGLGARAALAGSIVFEVNGVFAWLRNAIFNPVAFLPWLFLVVECLLAEAQPPERRLRIVCLGGVTAALALYAGFPEQVYLYGLLLLAWTVFRLCALPFRHIVRVVTDLILTGLLGVALSAPLLVCFVDYIRVAELGSHSGTGFGGVWLNLAAIVQYIMPYVYGQIFAASDPVVYGIWSGTGGYIGFVPLVLSIASLMTPDRRGTKLFLAAWIILALGVTQGAPAIHDAAMALPLMKAAAVYRYLNASWIFCFVFLSALFLDDAARLSAPVLKRTVALALAIALLLSALAAAAAWPVIGRVMAASPQDWLSGLSVAGVGLLAVWVGWQARRGPRGGRGSALAIAMVLEAVAWFAVPYLSYPRRGRLDHDLVSFLRDHVGYQRVLGVDSASLYPNYGSAFGISLLNYDDLPSPSLTAAYVRTNLDPDAGNIAYSPVPDGLSEDQQARRLRILHARLPAFARAGVKFVLGSDGFQFVSPYDIDAREAGAFALPPGQGLDIRGRVDPGMRLGISAMSVRLERLDEAASGHVKAALCVEAECVAGLGDIAATDAARWLSIAFDRRIEFRAGAAYTLHIERVGGDGRVALPSHALASAETDVQVSGPAVAGAAAASPELRFSDTAVREAYSGESMRVYELGQVRDYLSADGCSLDAASRDSLQASCPAPARLIRLEAALPGWSALVNGAQAAVGTVEDAFQAVDLPAGVSRIEFSYSPRHWRPALAAAGAALASLVLAGGWLTWRSVAERYGRA